MAHSENHQRRFWKWCGPHHSTANLVPHSKSQKACRVPEKWLCSVLFSVARLLFQHRLCSKRSTQTPQRQDDSKSSRATDLRSVPYPIHPPASAHAYLAKCIGLERKGSGLPGSTIHDPTQALPLNASRKHAHRYLCALWPYGLVPERTTTQATKYQAPSTKAAQRARRDGLRDH